jgi:hypothetical protein
MTAPPDDVEKDGAKHAQQEEEVMPSRLFEYFPAGQDRQEATLEPPDVAYLPKGHGTQSRLLPLYLPAGQEEPQVESRAENVPEGH